MLLIKGAQARHWSSLAPQKSGVRAPDLETGAGRGRPLEEGKGLIRALNHGGFGPRAEDEPGLRRIKAEFALTLESL